MKYRNIVESRLGAKLDRNQVIHHINGDHTDDRPENLLVLPRHVHALMHADGYMYFDPHYDTFVEGPRNGFRVFREDRLTFLLAIRFFLRRKLLPRSYLRKRVHFQRAVLNGTARKKYGLARYGLWRLMALVDKLG